MLYHHENPFNRQIHADTCTLLAEADALTVTCYCVKSYLVDAMSCTCWQVFYVKLKAYFDIFPSMVPITVEMPLWIRTGQVVQLQYTYIIVDQ